VATSEGCLNREREIGTDKGRRYLCSVVVDMQDIADKRLGGRDLDIVTVSGRVRMMVRDVA
jgi:hypothetical protein